jgi:hypothetical protein
MTTARISFLDESGKEIKAVVLAGLVVSTHCQDQTEVCNLLELLKGLVEKDNQTMKVAGTVTEVI